MKKLSARSAKKSAGSQQTKSEKPALLKAGYYIREDQDTLLEKIRLAVRERTGEKRDKSELIREAIDDLAEKYGVR